MTSSKGKVFKKYKYSYIISKKSQIRNSLDLEQQPIVTSIFSTHFNKLINSFVTITLYHFLLHAQILFVSNIF